MVQAELVTMPCKQQESALHLRAFVPSPHFQSDFFSNLEAVKRNRQVSSLSHFAVIDASDHIPYSTITQKFWYQAVQACEAGKYRCLDCYIKKLSPAPKQLLHQHMIVST